MNENILVIEYRNELVEKIVDILKERHYNPISTKSRSQGIVIANESSIDLIILDADIGDSHKYGNGEFGVLTYHTNIDAMFGLN